MSKYQDYLNETKEFLTETKRELVKTSLKGAIKYSTAKFKQYGKDLYDVIPDFDKHYEFAQTHASGGHTLRKDMPVIGSADIKKFKQYVENLGHHAKFGKVEVGSLHPVQKQIYISKSIDSIAENDFKKTLKFLQDKITVISKDHYLIDGHHRFLTAMLIDPNMKVNALIIDMPIADLLPASLEFSDSIGNTRNESQISDKINTD